MDVKIITHTNTEPIRHIAEIAGTCYNKSDKSLMGDYDILESVKNLWKRRHYSPFEFYNITVDIKGISRVALAQITRHWGSSFMVKSGRYCKESTPEFHLPVTLEDMWHTDGLASYDGTPFDIASLFDMATELYASLLERGVKAEDARYILPQALLTDMKMQFNLRDWFCSIAPQRCSLKAQKEIRDVCQTIDVNLRDLSPLLKEFSEWYFDGEGIESVERK